MRILSIIIRLILAVHGIAAAAVAGEFTIARHFASHMVLPMRCEVPVCGTASPGSSVVLKFRDVAYTTTAAPSGAWRIPLPAMEPTARPATMVIEADGRRMRLDDLLVGRVFLCSGQSNMDFPLGLAIGGKAEARTAGRFPAMRLCNLTGVSTDAGAYDDATLSRLNEREHFQGTWQRASQGSATAFSALAWWTGRMIHERDGVPVGLVENAVGGSGTEAWLPRNVLSARRAYRELLDGGWFTSRKISPWAQGRARGNLGQHPRASHPFTPGFLFESGLREWSGFPFDAVLWYQGETNAEIGDDAWNRRLITDLVTGWRRELGQPRLPFHIVQLPRIGDTRPIRRHWPDYRRVQAQVARALPDVHLVVTQDLGWDSPDVHPPDKLPIARRLAASIPLK
ncbi:hypothetical protein OKA04_09100 [Luteolibacter flavescens]|uniref:Sialate O-acetylesterase domain-containing protein n=1 Tax=Luteolibacter flavescens TaxID=1859460 RepID=A0ABT3FNU8_9BACT|nr:sialate O-acetylesterase [Luteolibacter flavescens]MCW1884884.1 hypothetical protein [Luteolibacter flavescens]